MKLMAYYCMNCGWQAEPDEPHARVNRCDHCRLWGLSVLTYDEDTESAQAAHILMTAYANRRVKGVP